MVCEELEMGIHPKIGITGLPRSGKSAVLDKVVSMVVDEHKADSRRSTSGRKVIGGMRTEAIIENGERVGYACIDIETGERGVMAHREIDSRNRILGYGIDPSEIDRIGVPAIRNAVGNCEILVVDEGLLFVAAPLNSEALDLWSRAWAANNNVNNYELESLPLPPPSTEGAVNYALRQ